ncbi:uncharacterized protein EI90DRAFT_554506 [Cantharellus anzutake]|uniref:uncharacterized protein n=1 Tax=Cantharellus anzutake TaxID=1750568 RepID=UPI001905C2EA|nr:uncharacterized protein EI90DRAFT_554506 [Cantharellus anzutake]KAF8313507.1 hypothetical protein EI90DRAFT_554506 [Cantharellus anzutake]
MQPPQLSSAQSQTTSGGFGPTEKKPTENSAAVPGPIVSGTGIVTPSEPRAIPVESSSAVPVSLQLSSSGVEIPPETAVATEISYPAPVSTDSTQQEGRTVRFATGSADLSFPESGVAKDTPSNQPTSASSTIERGDTERNAATDVTEDGTNFSPSIIPGNSAPSALPESTVADQGDNQGVSTSSSHDDDSPTEGQAQPKPVPLPRRSEHKGADPDPQMIPLLEPSRVASNVSGLFDDSNDFLRAPNSTLPEMTSGQCNLDIGNSIHGQNTESSGPISDEPPAPREQGVPNGQIQSSPSNIATQVTQEGPAASAVNTPKFSAPDNTIESDFESVTETGRQRAGSIVSETIADTVLPTPVDQKADADAATDARIMSSHDIAATVPVSSGFPTPLPSDPPFEAVPRVPSEEAKVVAAPTTAEPAVGTLNGRLDQVVAVVIGDNANVRRSGHDVLDVPASPIFKDDGLGHDPLSGTSSEYIDSMPQTSEGGSPRAQVTPVEASQDSFRHSLRDNGALQVPPISIAPPKLPMPLRKTEEDLTQLSHIISVASVDSTPSLNPRVPTAGQGSPSPATHAQLQQTNVDGGELDGPRHPLVEGVKDAIAPQHGAHGDVPPRSDATVCGEEAILSPKDSSEFGLDAGVGNLVKHEPVDVEFGSNDTPGQKVDQPTPVEAELDKHIDEFHAIHAIHAIPEVTGVPSNVASAEHKGVVVDHRYTCSQLAGVDPISPENPEQTDDAVGEAHPDAVRTLASVESGETADGGKPAMTTASREEPEKAWLDGGRCDNGPSRTSGVEQCGVMDSPLNRSAQRGSAVFPDETTIRPNIIDVVDLATLDDHPIPRSAVPLELTLAKFVPKVSETENDGISNGPVIPSTTDLAPVDTAADRQRSTSSFHLPRDSGGVTDHEPDREAVHQPDTILQIPHLPPSPASITYAPSLMSPPRIQHATLSKEPPLQSQSNNTNEDLRQQNSHYLNSHDENKTAEPQAEDANTNSSIAPSTPRSDLGITATLSDIGDDTRSEISNASKDVAPPASPRDISSEYFSLSSSREIWKAEKPVAPLATGLLLTVTSGKAMDLGAQASMNQSDVWAASAAPMTPTTKHVESQESDYGVPAPEVTSKDELEESAPHLTGAQPDSAISQATPLLGGDTRNIASPTNLPIFDRTLEPTKGEEEIAKLNATDVDQLSKDTVSDDNDTTPRPTSTSLFEGPQGEDSIGLDDTDDSTSALSSETSSAYATATPRHEDDDLQHSQTLDPDVPFKLIDPPDSDIPQSESSRAHTTTESVPFPGTSSSEHPPTRVRFESTASRFPLLPGGWKENRQDAGLTFEIVEGEISSPASEKSGSRGRCIIM